MNEAATKGKRVVRDATRSERLITLGPVWRGTHQSFEYQELNVYLMRFDGIAFGCWAALVARRLRLIT